MDTKARLYRTAFTFVSLASLVSNQRFENVCRRQTSSVTATGSTAAGPAAAGAAAAAGTAARRVVAAAFAAAAAVVHTLGVRQLVPQAAFEPAAEAGQLRRIE